MKDMGTEMNLTFKCPFNLLRKIDHTNSLKKKFPDNFSAFNFVKILNLRKSLDIRHYLIHHMNLNSPFENNNSNQSYAPLTKHFVEGRLQLGEREYNTGHNAKVK